MRQANLGYTSRPSWKIKERKEERRRDGGRERERKERNGGEERRLGRRAEQRKQYVAEGAHFSLYQQ